MLKQNIYHKLRYSNMWLYSVLNDTITVNCRRQQEPEIKRIQGQGIIEVKRVGCKVYTKDATLTTVGEYQYIEYVDFISKVEKGQIMRKIPTKIVSRVKWLDRI